MRLADTHPDRKTGVTRDLRDPDGAAARGGRRGPAASRDLQHHAQRRAGGAREHGPRHRRGLAPQRRADPHGRAVRGERESRSASPTTGPAFRSSFASASSIRSSPPRPAAPDWGSRSSIGQSRRIAASCSWTAARKARASPFCCRRSSSASPRRWRMMATASPTVLDRRRRDRNSRDAQDPSQERGLHAARRARREAGARADRVARCRYRALRCAHAERRRAGDPLRRAREGSVRAGDPDDRAGRPSLRDPGGERGRLPLHPEAVRQRRDHRDSEARRRASAAARGEPVAQAGDQAAGAERRQRAGGAEQGVARRCFGSRRPSRQPTRSCSFRASREPERKSSRATSTSCRSARTARSTRSTAARSPRACSRVSSSGT